MWPHHLPCPPSAAHSLSLWQHLVIGGTVKFCIDATLLVTSTVSVFVLAVTVILGKNTDWCTHFQLAAELALQTAVLLAFSHSPRWKRMRSEGIQKVHLFSFCGLPHTSFAASLAALWSLLFRLIYSVVSSLQRPFSITQITCASFNI